MSDYIYLLLHLEMELNAFQWSERDNRCAIIKVLVASKYSMTNEAISKAVGVPIQTVQDVRKKLMEADDIESVLEGKPTDQKKVARKAGSKQRTLKDAREVRSKEWIQRLQDLIDLEPTRSMPDIAVEMGCDEDTISESIKVDLKSRIYRSQTSQVLSEKLMDRRMLKCIKLLNMLKRPEEPDMLWFFSDEKSFCQDSQNKRWFAKSPIP